MDERDSSIKNPDSLLAWRREESGLGSELKKDLASKLERYETYKFRALSMADYVQNLYKSQYFNHQSLVTSVKACGSYLLFNHYYTVDETRLISAAFCKKHLLCPFCAMRRSIKYLAAYMERLEIILKEKPYLKAYMVTLTVVDGEDLEERFEHLRDSMKLMSATRRKIINNPDRRRHIEMIKASGGVHSIEVKRGKNSGLWHPHAHMIWLCEEAPDQAKLSEEWLRFTGDSYIVNVTEFYDQDNLIKGFLEVFKYALKFSDMTLEDNWEAFSKLKGSRLVDSFGDFRNVDVSNDLADEEIEDLPYIELFYKFLNQSYSLEHKRVFNLENDS